MLYSCSILWSSQYLSQWDLSSQLGASCLVKTPNSWLSVIGTPISTEGDLQTQLLKKENTCICIVIKNYIYRTNYCSLSSSANYGIAMAKNHPHLLSFNLINECKTIPECSKLLCVQNNLIKKIHQKNSEQFPKGQ